MARDEPQPEAVVHHRSSASRRRRKASPITLNLTSMIDVIFQLLIYFIITASFTQDEGVLAAKMPPADAAAPPDIPPQVLVVQLAPAGERCLIAIENDPVPVRNFTELATRLSAKQYDPERGRRGVFKPGDPVRIRSEGLVRWQHVVNAFNAAISARYTDVGFAPPPREEG